MTNEFAALDVEATGMDPARDEILEVAVVVFDEAGERERFASLVRPRGKVSLDIARLTGIEPAELIAAPPWADVAPTVRRLLDGRAVVGQSVGFDLAMLAAVGIAPAGPVYDIYQLATLLLHDLPAYSLRGVAAALGVDAWTGHRALNDACIAAEVFRRLLTRVRRFDAATLEQLAALTRFAGMSEADLFARLAGARPTGPLFAGTDEAVPRELAFLTARERPEPLRSTGDRGAVNPDEVAALLAPGGPISRVVAGYERRPAQEAMAEAVARNLAHGGELLVEAGTGTGKSLAYLLPAALHAVRRGESVVVSTNTLALQDQLYRKDVPDLRAALNGGDGEPFSVTLLKGRSNYLCLRQWFDWARQPTLDPAEARLKAKLHIWLRDTETGDRAELHLDSEEEAAWRHVAEDEGSCVPARCVFQQRNQCFLYRARRRAEAAHLIIVNHALLLSDVVAGSRVLPAYDHLVIDEAHHLEDQATNQLGFSLSERDLEEFAASAARREGAVPAGSVATAAAFLGRLPSVREASQKVLLARSDEALTTADAVRLAGSRLFARLEELIGNVEGGGYERTLRVTGSVRRGPEWGEIEGYWEPLDAALRRLDGVLRWFEGALAEADDGDDEEVALQREELGIEVGLAIRAGAELAARLQQAIASPDPAMVFWLERSPMGDRISLHAAPLDVGAQLQELLFQPLRSVTLTSATLTTDGSFDFIQRRLGLERARTLAVPSPFDYERSTLLYLVDDVPEPNAVGYQRALQDTLIEVCAATGGRALVLFTSHAALGATARAIKRPLEEQGVLVLAQRLDGTPRQLVERLRHTPNTVVLGTSTFWEGVDIVGPALSLLVITKLPFSVPSDPVFAARSELFDDPFGEYAVPQAVLRFKQGFGRLIRSARDRGVCAVLDRRVLSRRYGSSFIESLPSCAVEIGSRADLPGAAADWLAVR